MSSLTLDFNSESTGSPARRGPWLVACEPNDTYTVSHYETHAGRTADSMVLDGHRDVHTDILKEAFNLTAAKSAKITRRITGRVRLYKRLLEPVPAKA